MVACVALGLLLLLNCELTYKQGINHQVQTIRIPLYLKVLDFFDRHYNYKNLVAKIIKKYDNQAERVTKIFNWTHSNILKVPRGLPIIDDHVWHIIVRGYGTNDQSCDVFSVLCNYAGVDAFFDFIYTKDKKEVMPLAFVRLEGGWSVFDPYSGVYFENKSGGFASIKQMQDGDAALYSIAVTDKRITDYLKYIANLHFLKDMGFKRANVQSPLRRLLYEVEKISERSKKSIKNNEKD